MEAPGVFDWGWPQSTRHQRIGPHMLRSRSSDRSPAGTMRASSVGEERRPRRGFYRQSVYWSTSSSQRPPIFVSLLSTFAQSLGRSLCALGRHDEAERLVPFGRDFGAPDDVGAQTLWRQVQALVESHRGEHAEAERLVREAVELSERTDMPNVQGDALCDLAEVLHAAGRTKEAAAVLEQALERYERKQNLAMAAQVRPKLEALRETALA
jgi:hypothetical protein